MMVFKLQKMLRVTREVCAKKIDKRAGNNKLLVADIFEHERHLQEEKG